MKTDKFLYQVEGLSNYGVTDEGKIYDISIKDNVHELVTFNENKRIYGNFRFDDTGKIRKFPIDLYVAYAKYGKLPFEVLHRFDDYKDCSIDSIYYDLPEPVFFDKKAPFDRSYMMLGSVRFNLIENSNPKMYITRDGTVYSTYSKKILKKYISDGSKGYYRVHITINDKYDTYKIHRLTYEAWVGKIPDDLVIDHINAHKYYNDISNLRAITHAENTRAAHDLKLGNSRWNTQEIHNACNALNNGGTVHEVVKALYMDDNNPDDIKDAQNLISALRDGRVYKDIAQFYDLYGNEDQRKLNDAANTQKFEYDFIKNVSEYILDGYKDSEIVSRFAGSGLTKASINNIRCGVQYYNYTKDIPGMKEYIDERKKYLSYIKEHQNLSDRYHKDKDADIEKYTRMLSLAKEGFNAREIGEKLGIPSTTVTASLNGRANYGFTSTIPEFKDFVENGGYKEYAAKCISNKRVSENAAIDKSYKLRQKMSGYSDETIIGVAKILKRDDHTVKEITDYLNLKYPFTNSVDTNKYQNLVKKIRNGGFCYITAPYGFNKKER